MMEFKNLLFTCKEPLDLIATHSFPGCGEKKARRFGQPFSVHLLALTMAYMYLFATALAVFSALFKFGAFSDPRFRLSPWSSGQSIHLSRMTPSLKCISPKAAQNSSSSTAPTKRDNNPTALRAVPTAKPLLVPISVNYFPHRQCNYSCQFCFHTTKNLDILPMDEAKRGLRMLADAGMKKVRLSVVSLGFQRNSHRAEPEQA
jgi:hypothetical protein